MQRAASKLAAARLNASPLDNLTATLQPPDIDASYRLQDSLNQQLAAATMADAIGYKIGCTTRIMQQYLGIEHPCAGVVFSTSVQHHHGTFNTDTLCRPGVECEIGVQIGSDMHAGKHYNADNCEPYVDAAMASIELVDDRWRDYTKIPATTLIADNFFAAGCVFGAPVQVTGSQLQQAIGTLRINGAAIASGCGTDILGHPYEALAWLANHLNERGKMLNAGDYVSLGSVVKTQWLKRGDSVNIEFSGLGGCSLVLQ